MIGEERKVKRLAAITLTICCLTEEDTNCTTWGILDGDPILTSREDTAWTKGNGTYTVDENGVKHETEWANQITENFYDGVFANKYRYAMSHVSFPAGAPAITWPPPANPALWPPPSCGAKPATRWNIPLPSC